MSLISRRSGEAENARRHGIRPGGPRQQGRSRAAMCIGKSDAVETTAKTPMLPVYLLEKGRRGTV